MLTKDFDIAGIAEFIKKRTADLDQRLPAYIHLLPSYTWNRNEEFLVSDTCMEEATADAAQVDVYLVPPEMSRMTDILIPFAQRTQKPIVLLPPVNTPLHADITAGLLSRGLEVYGSRSWEEMLDQLDILRVKKVLANTKILCPSRFGTTRTNSAGDNLIDPDRANAVLGVRFQFINAHELLDQTHIGDPTQNLTLPGRAGLNPTEAEVAEMNAMTDDLMAGAAECTMAREEVFHSFRAYGTIKKMLDYYNCNAFCAPCPDICATRRFNEEHFTFCMTHSLLNEQGISSACEYDLCAVIAMTILSNFSRSAAYMGNTVHSPLSLSAEQALWEEKFFNLGGKCDTSYIRAISDHPENIIFTWHSVPNRKLHGYDSERSSYGIHPFTGSGWGVTLRYDFNQDAGTAVTMCRLDPSCRKLLVAKGEIVAGRGYDDDGCSLGVFLRVKDGNDFYKKQMAFGNHVPLVYGDCFDKVCALGALLGLEVVTA